MTMMTSEPSGWQPTNPSANGRSPRDRVRSGSGRPERPAQSGVHFDASVLSVQLKGGGRATLYLAVDLDTRLTLGTHVVSGESESGSDAAALARRVHLDLKRRGRPFDFAAVPVNATFVDQDFRRTLDELGIRLILEAR